MHPFLRKSLKAVHRSAGRVLPPALLARTYAGVPYRVHVDDLMLRDDAPWELQRYVDGGLCAVRHLEEALALDGRRFDDVGTCLDLPSGYGRVLRHLVHRIPPARITACDADREAVRFCAREFGVRPLVGDRDPRRTSFPARYDLVFVGSLLTHLREADGLTLLDVLVGILAPRGVLVFTTQGETCLSHLDWYGAGFRDTEATYRTQLDARGIGFVPYPPKRIASMQSPADPSYGVTIHARSWIEAAMRRFAGMELRRFRERGWESHQDVWTYQRAGSPAPAGP